MMGAAFPREIFNNYSLNSVHLTVFISVYSSVNGDVTEDQTVSLADLASYVAKKAGKNRVAVKAHA